MAVAADYSNWVRELDEYQNGEEQYDERLEGTNENEKGSRPALSSRSIANTNRKMMPRETSAAATASISQTEELQQEMKLLNWHKLANEAALKAAIIKTNKIKQEDSQFASALTQGEREERAQRAQQIIEEEQLKPLQVNTEFFRNLEAKGQRDEAKLDDDVQRHIQHLRKLKESMTQREDMQRRRQQYREKMQDLQASGSGMNRSKTLSKGSNQDDEANSPNKRDRSNPNSVYHRAAMAAGGKAALDNANVVTSLDKLMELEQRIRHLEDAGLAVDDLDEARGGNTSSRTAGSKQTNVGSGLRFAKRRATGGLHEPSRTVYAVTGASKMRSRDKSTVSSSRRAQVSTAAANARKRTLNSSNNTATRNRMKSKADTFLTSLPENKQRQLRRMTDRERRNFLKNEKAKEVRDQARKQDVVIEDWLEKKRAAANQRKAATSQVRAGAAAKAAAAGTSRNQKQRLPPPPRVRAPAVGAASGKRIGNSHLQTLDDIKKGYTKRKEAFQRLPSTTNRSSSRFNSTTTTTSRHQRSFTRSAVVGANTRQNPGTQRYGRTTLPPARAAVPTRYVPRGKPASGPIAAQITSKLPQIQRSTTLPSALPRASRRPGPVLIGGNNATLPRLSTQSRSAPMPSPPATRNANMPTFSRLHRPLPT
ncbi:hypothetical protein P3T76_005674 [Phytophthora citrophthora]|uniref:Uncharacterized protein n=1 Tax=Phytophthora citrophthora TaxID=4793 RepID=A0AAD9GQN6_9STRA|nr:hypothetical protein P3T76_005674 [Phytophthora citrophthora]